MKIETIGEYEIHKPTSGGKAGKGRNKTSTIQVRKGPLIVRQFRYEVADFSGGYSGALKKAKDFCTARSTVREKLIEAGVKNLREFGYPHCMAENILTDMIYSQFFLRMLRDNLGQGFDTEIKKLMEEISRNEPAP